MGNLHAHVPEQVLLATFLPSRPVSFVQVYRDSRTSFSCGSGFVTFAHRHNVENVLNTQMLSKTHRQKRLGYGVVSNSQLDDSIIATLE